MLIERFRSSSCSLLLKIKFLLFCVVTDQLREVFGSESTLILVRPVSVASLCKLDVALIIVYVILYTIALILYLFYLYLVGLHVSNFFKFALLIKRQPSSKLLISTAGVIFSSCKHYLNTFILDLRIIFLGHPPYWGKLENLTSNYVFEISTFRKFCIFCWLFLILVKHYAVCTSIFIFI